MSSFGLFSDLFRTAIVRVEIGRKMSFVSILCYPNAAFVQEMSSFVAGLTTDSSHSFFTSYTTSYTHFPSLCQTERFISIVAQHFLSFNDHHLYIDLIIVPTISAIDQKMFFFLLRVVVLNFLWRGIY